MAGERSGRPARGTRPRNRRALILDAAADLFVRVGYPRVAMSDVAEAVAIAPSALYRHFRGKEDLLHETVRTPLIAIAASLEGREADQLEDLLVVLASGVMDHRGLGILWQRESRHLSPERRDELRGLLVDAQQVFASRLRVERPEFSEPQSDLIAWATLAGLMSAAFQRVELPRDEYVALLADLGRDIVCAPVGSPHDELEVVGALDPVSTGAPAGASGDGATTAERLVATAARLFAERGFQTVGIDEVAAEVGIAGPSVYHHFAGKAELLDAAMGDGARILLSEQDAILGRSEPPERMLADLVRSYVDFSFDHRHVVDLMITETASLAPERSRNALDQQRRYVGEWVRLLGLVHPDLPAGHARVRVQAVLTITNDISRTTHLSAQPGVRGAVTAIGAAVLLGGPAVRDPALGDPAGDAAGDAGRGRMATR